MSTARTPNNIEILAAKSDVSQQAEYITSHNGILNVNATISTAGLATSDNQTNGNQITRISNTLITVPFDYISADYPDTSTEIYTYKIGGSGGTIVGVITVVYSDAVTKNIISSVTRS